jgi:hypothetical protein
VHWNKLKVITSVADDYYWLSNSSGFAKAQILADFCQKMAEYACFADIADMGRQTRQQCCKV